MAEEAGEKAARRISYPFRKVKNMIIWIVAAILTLFVFWFVGTFLYSAFTTGQLPEYAGIWLEKLHIRDEVAYGVKWTYKIATFKMVTEEQFTFAGTTKEKKEKIGISVTKFEPWVNVVRIGEPVLATAEIEVSTVPSDQDLLLIFDEACYLEDYTDLETPKQVAVNPQEQFLFAGQEGFKFNVECEFTDGFSELRPSDLASKVEGKIERNYDLKKLRFMPKFTFNQEMDWQPFVKYSRSAEDKSINPSWGLSTGPASLRVGSSETQPFYVNEKHRLYVFLEANWQGEIHQITNIRLELPPGIELLTDDKFCDFKRVRADVYELSSPVLQESNIDCSSSETLKALAEGTIGTKVPLMQKASVSFEECIAKYKSEFKFSCPFVVNNAATNAEKTQITARASYIYSMSETNSINLFDPNLGVA